MPFMICTNVIDNYTEKSMFDTKTVDYFDDRVEAIKAYNQLLADINDYYIDSANRESITFVYFYEYKNLDHGDHTNISITSLIHSAAINGNNYELFIGLRQ